MTGALLKILRNMGPRYVAFRAFYEIRRRTGLLRLGYPTRVVERPFVSLAHWREQARPFLFARRDEVARVPLPDVDREALRADAERIRKGTIRFFNGEWLALGPGYDWLTNPKSGYRFTRDTHWTQVEDFGEAQGDIKYVWEKARFTYVQNLLRADHHLDTDSSPFVFSEIVSWLDANVPNCGPHYKCSEEIALRVINWVLALYFYRDSPALDETTFERVLATIHVQMRHVERNLSFSRIAVRNNHAISEGLGLYVVGLLFPWFPRARRWRRLGKKVLEQEALFQIAPDGSYVQHSLNYQRMVVQLYAFALALARVHDDAFAPAVCERLTRMVVFLRALQDENTGMLPNYGPNDGSLCLVLSSCDYRDYRPQLHALARVLGGVSPYGPGPWEEESAWLLGATGGCSPTLSPSRAAVQAFTADGYYVLRHDSRFCMIRCGNHRGRPAHADNLHIDIWYKGVNVARDSGTFSYNTDKDVLDFFMGTRGHNTVMLGGQDQMRRGPRFIWYDWSRALDARVCEEEDALVFEGSIVAFRHIAPGIVHRRVVRMHRSRCLWEIVDTVTGYEGEVTQCWNLADEFERIGMAIVACDNSRGPLRPRENAGWFSDTYGVKQRARCVQFVAPANYVRTWIGMAGDVPVLASEPSTK